MALPDATHSNPECGACHNETSCGIAGFTCGQCGLTYDPDSLKARFTDPDTEPCGKPCGNLWHGPNRIRVGLSFECGSCQLPAGHVHWQHWTDCRAIEASK